MSDAADFVPAGLQEKLRRQDFPGFEITFAPQVIVDIIKFQVGWPGNGV